MMKLIDVTVYYGNWPYWPLKITTAQAIIGLMDRWNINRAVVASTRSVFLTCQDGHQELQDFVKDFPDRIIGFPIVSPKDGEEALQQVESAHQYGAKGLRMFPQHHQYRLDDDPTLVSILTLAQEYDMVVQIPCRIMLHWGLPQLDVREIDGIAARFPKLKIMTGGLNYSELRDLLGLMRRRDNVTFEISCLQVFDGIKTVVEKIGADRLFFGTGMPLQYPSPGIAKTANALISDEDKEKIFGLNAIKLLNL